VRGEELLDELEDSPVNVILGSGGPGENAKQDALGVLVGRVGLCLAHQQREDRVLADVLGWNKI